MALQLWLPLNKDVRNIGLNNAEATNMGATVNNDGKTGKCFYFDGSHYIDTGFAEDFGTGDFSISAWIYIVQTAGKTYQCIVGSKARAAASAGCAIYWNQNQKKFMWSTADGTASTEIWTTETFDTVVYNQWHNIIMVRDNKDSRKGYFYFDGVRKEIASVPAIRNVSTSTTMKIGSITPSDNAYFFTGKINDVRVYDHAILEEDAKNIYNCKIMDICASENYGGFFYDNSGIIVNDLVSTDVTFSGNSMYFNGTSSLIRPADGVGGLNITGGTFSFWYMPPSKPTSKKMIYFLDSKSQMTLGVFSSGNYFAVSVGINNKQPVYSTSNLVYGQLNNVIISYNSSYVPQFCLINGQQATAGNNDYWSGSGGLSIGGRYDDTNTLANCYITRFTVYNKTFTLEEAQELYARGVGRDGVLPEGYAQLEYIQATGGQYIDTGIKPCMNKIRCICDFAPMTTGDTAFFGTRGTYFVFYKLGDNYTWPISKTESIKGTLQTDVKYHIDWNKGKMFLVGPDGVLHKATRSNNTQDNSTMYIFNFNPLDGSGRTAKAKLYNFQIYFDDVLVRNFIPAKRLSDNVLGLYDTVTDALFTNGGSGSFTAGPVV